MKILLSNNTSFIMSCVQKLFFTFKHNQMWWEYNSIISYKSFKWIGGKSWLNRIKKYERMMRLGAYHCTKILHNRRPQNNILALYHNMLYTSMSRRKVNSQDGISVLPSFFLMSLRSMMCPSMALIAFMYPYVVIPNHM